MTKLKIGYRLLISKYGYYGNIGRPYVLYSIKTAEILSSKKERLDYLLKKLNSQNISCDGSNWEIMDKLEHLIIQVHNEISGVKLECIHPFIISGKLRRMDHEDSIILPLFNRVVTSKILVLVIDLVNNDANEMFPDYLIKEVMERIPDNMISKILKILELRNISNYDIEDDSRLLALGEGKSSIVIMKRTDQNFINFLKYPFPFLDVDDIADEQWRRFDIKNYYQEGNLDRLSKKLENNWVEFNQLVNHGSIPKYLVTGTNGKTSTARILAHILRSARNEIIGITSTNGIFVDGLDPEYGDFTGPWSARNTLLKPIDIGVFETARGGLIREGVIFDNITTAIITNVAADHLGLRGIDSVEKMLRVKSLILHPAVRSIILYADDPQLFQLFSNIKRQQFEVKSGVKIWGVSSKKEILSEFDYGLLIHNGQILLMSKGLNRIGWEKVGSLKDLRVSNYGLISFMNINAVLALAAAISVGIDYGSAFQNLIHFTSDIDNIPGRGNFFEKSNRWFMVDYGHNTHALEQIKITINNIKSKYKINKVIFLALIPGDRREEDLAKYGNLLSTISIDEVIFKDLWEDLRGKETGEIGKIMEKILTRNGFKGKIFHHPEPIKAIEFAISRSNEMDLIYLCSEKPEILMQLISDYNYEN